MKKGSSARIVYTILLIIVVFCFIQNTYQDRLHSFYALTPNQASKSTSVIIQESDTVCMDCAGFNNSQALSSRFFSIKTIYRLTKTNHNLLVYSIFAILVKIVVSPILVLYFLLSCIRYLCTATQRMLQILHKRDGKKARALIF